MDGGIDMQRYPHSALEGMDEAAAGDVFTPFDSMQFRDSFEAALQDMRISSVFDEIYSDLQMPMASLWSDAWRPSHSHTEAEAQNTLSSVQAQPPRTQCQYIFIDNGNVFVGAQSLANGAMDLAIRVNVKELAELIQGRAPCMVKEVAASRPSNPRICSAWKKINYSVRKDTDVLSARQSLCESIQRTLLSYDRSHGPQTLVMATGDGTQFPHLAEVAVSLGWHVIIWSWSRCLSEKFKKVRAMHPDQITIKLFDEFRHRITFRAPERASPPSSPSQAQASRRPPKAQAQPNVGAPASANATAAGNGQRRRRQHRP